MGASGYDIYHFQTNQNMVEVLDSADVVRGTLGQLMFEGRPVTTGAVTDIKVSGLYAIKGLTGLPSGLAAGTEYIMQVEAIGPVNNPRMRTYKIVGTDGSLYNRTVSSAGTSAWTNGGTVLQALVNRLNTDLGTKSALKTATKVNVVAAINELKDEQVRQGATISGQGANISTHTHDERYVRKDAPTDVAGVLTILNGNGLKSKALGSSASKNVVMIDSNGGVTLGDVTGTTSIAGRNDLTYNGSKVWTVANHGTGSGLDADKLKGVDGTQYARKDADNIMTKQQLMRGAEVKFENSATVTSTNLVTTFTANGSQTKNQSGQIVFEIDRTSGVHSNGVVLKPFTGTNPTNASITLKQSTPDSGVTMEVDTGTGDLQFKNNRNGMVVGGIKKAENVAFFNRAIKVNGRTLYLQDTQPTGTHAIGSVWIAQN